MDAEKLRSSQTLPAGLSAPLQALWHVAKGDWETAHDTIKDVETAEAAWVHAHLHRVEGDQDNANYWYNRAGKPTAKDPHAEEWAMIATALIGLGPR